MYFHKICLNIRKFLLSLIIVQEFFITIQQKQTQTHTQLLARKNHDQNFIDEIKELNCIIYIEKVTIKLLDKKINNKLIYAMILELLCKYIC